MSELAFLTAMRDAILDDTPRLVFADWLEERGEASRAEFIRIQCKLDTVSPIDPERTFLEDRQHELLRDSEATWWPPSNPTADMFREWTWRRGYPDDVTVPLDQVTSGAVADQLESLPLTRCRFVSSPDSTLHDAETFDRYLSAIAWDAIPWAKSLVGLDLSERWENVAQFAGLIREWAFPNLRELNLLHLPTTGNSLVAVLSRSQLASQLKSLSFGNVTRADTIWGNINQDPIDVESLIQALPGARLEKLVIPDVGLTSEDIAPLFSAESMQSLTHLDLSDNPLGPTAAYAFNNTPIRLNHLNLSGTALGAILLREVLNSSACSQLKSLVVNRCGSARENLSAIAESPFWSQAESLHAQGGTIPLVALDSLFASSGSMVLRHLDVSDNYFRTEGVQLLADAKWASGLAWLSLTRNYLDDAALAILGSGAFANLRTLHLSRNNLTLDQSFGEMVTDQGLLRLVRDRGLPNLRLLTLSETHISDVGLIRFLQADGVNLSGLGVSGCGLTWEFVEFLAGWPGLLNLDWLDLSYNPQLSGDALMLLANSPYLSRMCELDISGLYTQTETLQALSSRLGNRLSR